MDDLLLFRPSKKSHIVKLEDLFKGLLKKDLGSSQRNAKSLERNYNIWVKQSLLKTREFVSSH